MFYKLEGKDVIEVSIEELVGLGRSPIVSLKRTELSSGMVSTSFLGLDHSFGGNEPVLFETMYFPKDRDGEEQIRYTTYDDAIKGHDNLVRRIKRDQGGLKNKGLLEDSLFEI